MPSTVTVQGAFSPVPAAALPDVPSGALAALSFARGGYKAWNGSQWVALTGATPAAASTAWTATFDFSSTPPRVRYAIGGTALAASGSEWIALSPARSYLTGVGFAGAGSAGDFKATYAGGGYVAPVLSSIEDGGVPALDFGAGTFSITINNAVKDAWYTVYASDTVDGEYEAVLSEQATADGRKTLSIPASKPARFVRIGVSGRPVDSGSGL